MRGKETNSTLATTLAGAGRWTAALALLVVGCGKARTPYDAAGSAAARAELAAAVRAQGGRSAEGSESPLLCQLAWDQAQAMAAAGQISHDGWDGRSEQIGQAGGSGQSEIVAYTSVSGTTAAGECAQLWRGSSGHWAIMQRSFEAYCYVQITAADGVYCIGIVANGVR